MVILAFVRVVVDGGVQPNLLDWTKLGKQLPDAFLRDRLVRLEARVNRVDLDLILGEHNLLPNIASLSRSRVRPTSSRFRVPSTRGSALHPAERPNQGHLAKDVDLVIIAIAVVLLAVRVVLRRDDKGRWRWRGRPNCLVTAGAGSSAATATATPSTSVTATHWVEKDREGRNG